MTSSSEFTSYEEFELTVTYRAVPASGDGWHEPREEAYIDIEDVCIGKVSILSELSKEQLDRITLQIEEDLSAAYEDYLEQKAEMEWERRYGY
jgi:hypothetical protein